MENLSPSDGQFIDKLNRIIQDKMTDTQFGVSELAREMGMSRSNLHRRVSEITGKTVIALISEARLKRALELLKEGLYTVSEVSWRAGFGSVTYFDKCFHDFYGFPPGEAKNRDLTKIPEDAGQSGEIAEDKLKKRDSILIAVLSLIVLASVIVVFILVKPFGGEHKEIEKSIAVLPFIDDSRDAGNAYIIEGLREEILNKLTMIGGIDVVSRTTSETYRKAGKTIKEIGRELNANYIIEGSAQTINNTLRIRLQLIETSTDKHLWSKPFERQLTPDNIFEIQQEVALLVTSDLGAIVTGKEKEKITIPYTHNKTAYNLFLQGQNYWKVYQKNNDSILLSKARELYLRALKLDSTYIEPCIEMGWTYVVVSRTVGGREQISYLDTGLMWAERALRYNPESIRAWNLKGHLLIHKGEFDEALHAINHSIYIDPNFAQTYFTMAFCYFTMQEHARAVEYYLKARKLNKEPLEDIGVLGNLHVCLTATGFKAESRKFVDLILAQENDSAYYYKRLRFVSFFNGDIEESLKILEYIYKKDTTDLETLGSLCWDCLFLRNYNALNYYFVKYERLLIKKYPQASGGMLGFMYKLNGQEKAAKECFEKNIRLSLEYNEVNHREAKIGGVAFNLATIYSVQGEKEKALEQLKLFKKRELCPYWTILHLKMNPMFDNIRGTPEFEDVLKDLEAKYQKGHEIVRKVLIREGLQQS